MQPARRRLLTLALAPLLARAAGAAEPMVTEVVPVGFRSADELLPLVRPLVPPPGSVGSIYNKLVIKTTRANLDEIKQVLASLDRAPANLRISVRHAVNDAVRNDLQQAYARVEQGDVTVRAGSNAGSGRGGVVIIGGNADNRIAARVLQTDSAEDADDVQSVRVLEGREAFIRSGESVPLADQSVIVTGVGTIGLRQGVRYEDVDSGFYVLARLAGDIVTLDISPHRRQLSRSDGGVIDVQSASTVVSGPLGRWMEIGGVNTASNARSSGIGYSTASGSSSTRSIFVKVDRLP